MATKPTRLQQKACDRLAEALRGIAEAYHLDGRGRLDAGDLREVARLIGQVSTAFSLDQIVARALEARGRSLGLTSGTADLIALNAETIDPLQTLRLGDAEFAELVKKLEEELGGL
jgi:hypothetical protein